MNIKAGDKSSFLGVVAAICGFFILYYFLASGYYVVRDEQGDWWLYFKGFWAAILCTFLAIWANSSPSLKDGKAGVAIGVLLVAVCMSPIMYDSVRKSDLFRPIELANAFKVDGSLTPDINFFVSDPNGEILVKWRPTYENSDVSYIEWRSDEFFSNNGCGNAKIVWELKQYRSYSLHENEERADICVPGYMFEAAKSALEVGAMRRGRADWGVYIGRCHYEHPSNNLQCIDLAPSGE